MIVVQFDNIKATIDEGVWTTDEDKKTEYMQTTLRLDTEFDITMKKYGWVGEADVDLQSAEAMVKRYGGKITDKSKHTPPPKTNDGDAKLGIVY